MPSLLASQNQASDPGVFQSIFNIFPSFIGALAVVIASFAIASMIRRAIMNSLAQHNADDQVALLVGKSVHVGVLIVGVTIALKILGIDITSIVGLFGLGFGFAMQDIIKNFVSGALILIQQPFRIGDVIKVGEYTGKVESIEARSTNIRSLDGLRVIIPNADVFSQSVTNYSVNPARRFEIVLGVDYAANLTLASQIAMDTLEHHPDILKNPLPQVVFTEFAASSINITLRFWLDVSSSAVAIKSNLIQKIKIAFDANAINIPFPIQTIHFDDTAKSSKESDIFLHSLSQESANHIDLRPNTPSKAVSLDPPVDLSQRSFAQALPLSVAPSNISTPSIHTPEQSVPVQVENSVVFQPDLSSAVPLSQMLENNQQTQAGFQVEQSPPVNFPGATVSSFAVNNAVGSVDLPESQAKSIPIGVSATPEMRSNNQVEIPPVLTVSQNVTPMHDPRLTNEIHEALAEFHKGVEEVRRG